MSQPTRTQGGSCTSFSSGGATVDSTEIREVRSNTATPEDQWFEIGIPLGIGVDYLADIEGLADEMAFNGEAALPRDILRPDSAGVHLEQELHGNESTQQGERNGATTARRGYPASHESLADRATLNESHPNYTGARPEGRRLQQRHTHDGQVNGNCGSSRPDFMDRPRSASAPNMLGNEGRGQNFRNMPNGQVNGNGRSVQSTVLSRFRPNGTPNAPWPEGRLELMSASTHQVNENYEIASFTTNSVPRDENPIDGSTNEQLTRVNYRPEPSRRYP
ncbi:hypothetical protein AJ78_04220 [Emergomyces pasteurianus Ep9510]|uniref:Uncharacterized protein n=1 Tax=Emergomyces pasteurianus Ep9510 TaxID=1447872 RepID=A0A1J9QHX7_9EURO|nr:hypothetical protein AJ78_04220 [Emergomyces pasteurianus Ep9510]